MRGFAVIDLETTGFSTRFDRILEIAIVQLAPDLTETGRWTSLLNPGRTVGAEQIHGVTPADVVHAPTFDDVAPTVMHLLKERALVAHNAGFDIRHLMESLGRAGYALPAELPVVVDTMRWASAAVGCRRLGDTCDALGITVTPTHAALDDALATAEVLREARLLDPEALLDASTAYRVHPDTDSWRMSRSMWTSADRPLDWLAACGADLTWPDLEDLHSPIAGLTRADAHAIRERNRNYLSHLVAQLPPFDDDPHSDATTYLALLDDALDDRVISPDEAEALFAAACESGLSRFEVRRANLAYLAALAAVAWEDDVITPMERSDLANVAALLDISLDVAEATIEAARAQVPQRRRHVERLGVAPGARVVFTGPMSRPRPELESQARSVGLVPTSCVSRRTALLVVDDPTTQTGKAKKAREYGTRIVSEPVFHTVCAELR